MNLLLAAVGGFGLTSAFWITLATYLYKNPDQFQKWAGMIAWAVTWFYEKADYFAIQNEFEGRMNGFVSDLETNSVTQLPRARIKFAASGEKEEFIWEERSAILIMRDRKHRTRNFVHAAYFYTTEILLRKSKLHLSKKQKESLDLFTTKKILDRTYAAAVEQFMIDYFSPHVEKNEDVRTSIAAYDEIFKKGLYFSILIQELTYLGHKVFLKKPTGEVVSEIDALVNFLQNYAKREDHDYRTPDIFIGKYMRCAIRIVAARETRERGDTEGHKTNLCRTFRDGFENIYIIGNDSRENRGFMERVVTAVLQEMPDVERVIARQVKGRIRTAGVYREVDTYLVHLHNPLAVKYLYSEEDLDYDSN